jgi:hypothetical protein
MGSRQIVLVSTAGFSVLNTGIFWREAKTKRLFSQCTAEMTSSAMLPTGRISAPLHEKELKMPAGRGNTKPIYI